jgi:hypothetical protein
MSIVLCLLEFSILHSQYVGAIVHTIESMHACLYLSYHSISIDIDIYISLSTWVDQSYIIVSIGY